MDSGSLTSLQASVAHPAALTIASGNLRLEVESFGIGVTTAMIGAVDTKIYSNNSTFELPAGSLYMPIKQQIADQNAQKHSPKGFDANTLAKSVVDDILEGKGKGETVVEERNGECSRLGKFVVPWGKLDRMAAAGTGIDHLTEAIKHVKG
ncbi:hypothetical protein MMC11_000616 [Xylographa trunciseda]|nr:hypothetical protein [Xylographa trunciseda]